MLVCDALTKRPESTTFWRSQASYKIALEIVLDSNVPPTRCRDLLSMQNLSFGPCTEELHPACLCIVG